MIDLGTTYLGMHLRSPLVHSSSPFGRDIDTIRRIEDAGAAAIVLPSLFEEEIERESLALHHFLSHSEHHYAEALSYFPEPREYQVGPEEYLELLHKAKQAVEIPILGSLNGVSTGGWVEFAHRIEEAGADALELNIYFIAANPEESCIEVERRYLDIVTAVKQNVSIPLAVKLSPYFSAFAHTAAALEKAGAEALVLFNRFYQPDIDLEQLEIRNDLELSTASSELRLRLRWVAILYGRIWADLAVTGGVHTAEDVLKCMMVGARVAMMTSAILRHGPEHFRRVEVELRRWMEEHGYESIQLMQGSMSQRAVADPSAFERANYLKILQSYRLDRP